MTGVPCMCVIRCRLGMVHVGIMPIVPGVLGQCRDGGGAGEQGEEQAVHQASPSSGRTVTTRIIPACMW